MGAITDRGAIVIKADGFIIEFNPANGAKITLDEARGIVGGHVQAVTIICGDTELLMLVNEEGKLIGLPENERATIIARATWSIDPRDHIVGDALLCPSEMFE